MMTKQQYTPDENHLELKDLVTKSLEAKGLLGKVQAELRAGVFLALEESDAFRIKNPFENAQLKNFANTPDGDAVISMVREFLDHFNLEFTKLVFDPEIAGACGYKFIGRKETAEKMCLNSEESGPLLNQILKQTRMKENCSTIQLSSKGFQISQENVETTETEELLKIRVQEMDQFQRSLQSKSIYIMPVIIPENDKALNKNIDAANDESKLPNDLNVSKDKELVGKTSIPSNNVDFAIDRVGTHAEKLLEKQKVNFSLHKTKELFNKRNATEEKMSKNITSVREELSKSVSPNSCNRNNITYLPRKEEGLKPFRVDLTQLNHLLDFHADGGEGYDEYEEELALSSALSPGEKSIAEELAGARSPSSSSSSKSLQKKPQEKCRLVDIEEYLRNVSLYLGNTDAVNIHDKRTLNQTPHGSPDSDDPLISSVSSIGKDNTTYDSTVSTENVTFDYQEDISNEIA